MRRPTLADVRAGAERAYERWRRWPQWKRELELAPMVPSAFDLLADRDALWVQLGRVINERKKLRAERDEARVELGRVRAGMAGVVTHVEQQLRAARELRDEACGERDSLVIERDGLRAEVKKLTVFGLVDDWASKARTPNPVSEAPIGLAVLGIVPMRRDDEGHFIDRLCVIYEPEELLGWLPMPDDWGERLTADIEADQQDAVRRFIEDDY